MMKKLFAFILIFMFLPMAVSAETADCSKFLNKTVVFFGETYLPVCETLELCGFEVSWSKKDFSYIAGKDGFSAKIPINSAFLSIDGKNCTLKNTTAFRNNVLYMPQSAAEKICVGYEFENTGRNMKFSVGDDFRAKDAVFQNGWYVCDNGFVFEPYYISSSGVAEYADIVRKIADSLPDVRVFDMLVPEGSEIYAPESLRCGQTEAFEKVCGLLPESVTAVNVCDALYQSANEKIYFNTDHHWTHRGSYYAYKAFLGVSGGSIAPLSSFESRDFYNYRGSYANFGFTGGEYEIMERFMPFGDNTGYVYENGSIMGEKHKIDIVNPNDNTYACFIGGDNGLTELCGTVKNGKKLCIVKESFGNALAVWAVNNYETVYVADIRKFEGTLVALYSETLFDDLLIESYAESVGSRDLRAALNKIVF